MFLRSRKRKASTFERRRSARSLDILGAVEGWSGIPFHPVERDEPSVQRSDNPLAAFRDGGFLPVCGGCVRSRFIGLEKPCPHGAAEQALERGRNRLPEKEIPA